MTIRAAYTLGICAGIGIGMAYKEILEAADRAAHAAKPKARP